MSLLPTDVPSERQGRRRVILPLSRFPIFRRRGVDICFAFSHFMVLIGLSAEPEQGLGVRSRAPWLGVEVRRAGSRTKPQSPTGARRDWSARVLQRRCLVAARSWFDRLAAGAERPCVDIRARRTALRQRKARRRPSRCPRNQPTSRTPWTSSSGWSSTSSGKRPSSRWRRFPRRRPAAFIDRGDGVLVPSRLLVRGLLAGLPSAGKTAYRLFYDAQATHSGTRPPACRSRATWRRSSTNHLISSVGDRAADRLGDLYFERGDFEQAIAAWQTCSTYCPDSKLSKPQTLVKIATALARAGRWNEFRDDRASSSASATPTKRSRSAAASIAGRRATDAPGGVGRRRRVDVHATSLPGRLRRCPRSDEPLWQFSFHDSERRAAGRATRSR